MKNLNTKNRRFITVQNNRKHSFTRTKPPKTSPPKPTQNQPQKHDTSTASETRPDDDITLARSETMAPITTPHVPSTTTRINNP